MGAASRSVEVRVEAPRRVLTEKDIEPSEDTAKPLDQMDVTEAIHWGETRRDEAPKGSWTIRMVISGRSDGLRTVARAAGSKASDLLILPFVRRDGLRFWQACYGIYPNRNQAVKAWHSAPEALRKAFLDALPQPLPPSGSLSTPTRE